LERLKQRIGKLRSAIRSLESSTKLNKLAEQVRDASVTVIKLKLSIIADQPAFLMGMMDHPQNDALKRQWENLERDAERWSTRSVDDIIAEYAKSNIADEQVNEGQNS